MAYFFVTDFNLQQTSDIYRGSRYARRETVIRSIDGTPAITHIPSMRGQISESISNAYILAPRSISLLGFRATDLPRELARYRNLSARAPSQALSLGHSWQHRQEYPRRCQRIPRLAYLSGFCAQPNQTGAQTLFSRQLRRRAGADRLRARHNHHRPVLERLPMGAFPSSKSCRQDAHAARSARQHSNIHPHQRWQDA